LGTQADFVGVLQSFVGIVETPDGSNLTPIGAEFGWNGVAWCCETVSVALKRAGTPALWTASVWDARERAKQGEKGMQWILPTGIPQAGDAILFDWTGGKGAGSPDNFHIGTILEVGPQSTFHTIEGNYRNQVAWVWRDLNFVQGFIRFPFDAPAAPTPQEVDVSWPSFVDPKNGNKVLAKPTGEFFNFDATGKPGGNKWLGNLDQFGAGDGKPNGPCVAIEPWDDGGPFSGILAFCVDVAGKIHPYNLWSDGRYGYAKKP
jgi:hypothetical protein